MQEVGSHLVVAGVYDGGPADAAGLAVGDVILEVAGEPVTGLSDLFRRVWSQGAAGVAVSLTVAHQNETRDLEVQSIDRFERFKSAQVH